MALDPRRDRHAEPLTDRQKQLFDFIWESARDHGFQPSIREIGKTFGISSPHGITCHLSALTNKGWIETSDNRSRAIIFLRNPDGTEFRGFEQKA
jgi:repressor LexA